MSSLASVGLIAADTTRTRAYLSAMEHQNIRPAWALILTDIKADRKEKLSNEDNLSVDYKDGVWQKVDININTPLPLWLQNLGVEFEYSDTTDINSQTVVRQIAACDPEVLIYSGYSGVLLRKPLLETGKRFLHVHGGYLPNYKGSTTSYYSLLNEGKLGASSLFLNSEIDEGPILLKRNFPPPRHKEMIDHTYDAAARAHTLIETLKAFMQVGSWDSLLTENHGGDMYYIIHPVLKHIAILGLEEEV